MEVTKRYKLIKRGKQWCAIAFGICAVGLVQFNLGDYLGNDANAATLVSNTNDVIGSSIDTNESTKLSSGESVDSSNNPVSDVANDSGNTVGSKTTDEADSNAGSRLETKDSTEGDKQAEEPSNNQSVISKSITTESVSADNAVQNIDGVVNENGINYYYVNNVK